MVFSVGLEYFFNPEPRPVLEIVRKKDRLRFPDSPDAARSPTTSRAWTSRSPDRALNSYLAEFEPVEAEQAGSTNTPASNSCTFCPAGWRLRAGEDKHELAEGDSIYFDSTVPHGYRRIGAKRTTALVVALPPGD